MRMWMINPKYLCRKHLLGEHNEIHKHRPSFEKKHSIKGRLSPIVLIEPAAMQTRHDEIVEEMLARGYNHKSPYTLPDLSYLSEEELKFKVDIEVSMQELMKRCPDCMNRMKG